ncbi:MAG TPA: EAL domain-containing protein [Burkholderiaceae bacterium]|nr:EAL domain-containing protein [Burkholderiaceae bacterium]
MMRTLRSRLVLFFVGLLVLAEATVLVLVDGAASRIATQEVDSGLRAGVAVFQRLLQQDRQQIERAGELLSADFAFREAVGTRDIPTAHSVLVNHGRRIGAGAMMIVGLDGQVIVDTLHPHSPPKPFPFADLLAAAGDSNSRGASGIVLLPEAWLYQIVVMPVLAPDLIGYVVIGFPVDDGFVQKLKTMTALEVSFAVRRADGAWTVLASTLPATSASRLATALAGVGHGADTMDFDVAGQPYLGRLAPLETKSNVPVVAALHRSVAEAAEPFDRLRLALLIVAAVTLLASVGGSIVLARRVAVPLQTLTSLARRIRDGDYATAARIDGPEEIEALADSLDHMREGIARREDEIGRLAYQDSLTGLPNRVRFQQRVDQVLRHASDTHTTAAVLLMDLDRFKNVNDALGHDVGDQVLQVVGKRLRGSLRDCDTVSRLGGDEFAVLLPGVDAEGARDIGERIAVALEEPIRLHGHTIDVGASIGATLYPVHGTDLAGLLRHADVAMYAAKRGRIQYALYDPAVEDTRAVHLSLLSELRRAVEQDELELRFQPKVDLAACRFASAEVLLRWTHPVRGVLPPSEFIPFAEHTGYIRELTRWLIEAAARQSGLWRAQGHTIRLALNVSARDLLNPDLPAIMAESLSRHGVPPDSISMEVTETALMEDPAGAHATVRRLRELGVKLSIDDYGTGFSSLAYIKRLAVDELKIDRAFIKELVHDADDQAIVRSTIELGHNLGLQVVAEGIEDAHTADKLREMGCDLGQGYHFARPLPADELMQWIDTCARLCVSAGKGVGEDTRQTVLLA